MGWWSTIEHACAIVVVLGLVGCVQTPPTTDGTTDLSDTDGDGYTGVSATGIEPGADETGGGGEGHEPVADHRTYYIGESVKFDGGGKCEGSRLATVTRRLRRRLDRAGWSGLRLVDDNAWPEDFWDPTEKALGLDGSLADAHRLAVYAGHGKPGVLQWGRPSDHGNCRAEIPSDVRLGQLSGDTAAAVMLVTSCTLRMDVLWTTFKENAVRQFFGFHNSPYVAPRELRDVFKRTQDGQSTKDAWLDELEDNADLGKNSPIVLTMGVDGPEAMAMHGATNLATGEGFLHNVGEPADAFFFEALDNGCSPSCGACPSLVPMGRAMPSLPAGTTVPIVELTRPQRSAAELTDRASVLVSLVQGQAASVGQRAQLEAWALRVVREADLAVTMLAPGPRIQLAYDPYTDHLVVDDLDARDAARPGLSDTSHPEWEQVDLEVARQVRDRVLGELDALGPSLVGVPRGSAFSVGTRKAGAIVSGVSTGPVPFETLFSAFGEFAGYPVFGAQLEIGVTRLGELSRLGVSALQVIEVGTAEIRRPPDEALQRLEQDVAASNPHMLRHEVVSARVGLVSPEGQSRSALAAPELAVDYVVLHSGDEPVPMVSRRYPARVSLVSDSSSRPRHGPDGDGADDDPGDPRP